MTETFEDCLSRSYKEDFNAELDFGGSLQPVRTFSIYDADGDREIPGIIFVATVQNYESVTSQNHTDIDWANPNDLDDFADSDCVDGFKETIRLAQRVKEDIVKQELPAHSIDNGTL